MTLVKLMVSRFSNFASLQDKNRFIITFFKGFHKFNNIQTAIGTFNDFQNIAQHMFIIFNRLSISQQVSLEMSWVCSPKNRKSAGFQPK